MLFQVGKIKEAFEGFDGPMSKVNRDFEDKGFERIYRKCLTIPIFVNNLEKFC